MSEQPLLIAVGADKRCPCGNDIPLGRTKYCSRKCQMRQHNAQLLERRKDFFALEQPAQLTGKNAEIVELKRNHPDWGSKTIARVAGSSHTQVRRVLKKAGLYHPHPKHNGFTKRGSRKYSRILKAERRKEREDKLRTLRQRMAQCLRQLRKGVSIEQTCREGNWHYEGIISALRRRPSYRLLIVNRKGQWAEGYRKAGVRSRLFKTELVFNNYIEEILKAAQIPHVREVGLHSSDTYPDFRICDSVIAESKVQTNKKAIYTLIGQLLHHKSVTQSHGGSCVLVGIIPSDCTMAQCDIEALKAQGISIVTECNIMAHLIGK